MKQEEWRPVVGWRGRYAVSSLGRVMAFPSGPGPRRPVLLKLAVKPDGYHGISLTRGSRGTRQRFNVKVHRLVAAAFLGPCPPGMVVNHKNAVKSDNRPENLEYVTPGDNTRHAASLGIMPQGERSHWARLDADAVREIRALRGLLSVNQIAARYSVCKGTISHIFAGTTWRSVR